MILKPDAAYVTTSFQLSKIQHSTGESPSRARPAAGGGAEHRSRTRRRRPGAPTRAASCLQHRDRPYASHGAGKRQELHGSHHLRDILERSRSLLGDVAGAVAVEPDVAAAH